MVLPIMSGHARKINETKCMSLLIEDDELLEKFQIKSAIVLNRFVDRKPV